MDDAIRKKLEKAFPPEKIKTKPGQGGRKMSYISHGLVNERLNDADPGWSSKTVAVHTYTAPDGVLHCAGVTIELTVGGVTRAESGGPQRQDGFANEIKNAFSDALKRAAMRFGVALGMWETLVDAEGDEDYSDAPVDRPTARSEAKAAPTPIRPATTATTGGANLAAVHAAAQGKIQGDPHQRAHALAEAVYGVPSMRELNPDQGDQLRKAFGECRSPHEGEALIALAIRTNAATSDDELQGIATDIGLAGFGPERTELMRAAFRRSRDAIKLMAEINAGQPALLDATGTAGADRYTQ